MNDSGLTEQFSLRWNNFHSNLSTEFHTLLQEEDLVDVTIAADGKFVQAHKVVLSVCSPYFKKLFKQNPCKHPIVILQDVPYTALGGLLQFMYCGEVSVCQEELPEFLKTAEMLQVKGLTGCDNQEQNKSLNKRPSTPEAKRKSKVPRRAVVDDQEGCDDSVRSESPVGYDVSGSPVPIDFSGDSDRRTGGEQYCEQDRRSAEQFYEQDSPPEEEVVEEVKPNVSAIAALLQANAVNENSAANYHHHPHHQPMPKTNSGPLTAPAPSFSSSLDQGLEGTQVLPVSRMLSVCPFCYKEFSTKSNLKIHMRDRHSGQGPWQCSLCSKLVKNKSSLRVHFYQQHRKPKTDIPSIPDLKPI